MKITATTTFLHGRERYEEGSEYDVESALAGYFVANGWASGTGRTARALTAEQEVTLDIQDGRHEMTSPEVGNG